MENEKSMIEIHDVMIKENILPRLDSVESGLKTVSDDVLSIKNGQKDLELTVLKQGQTNRELQEQSNNMITQLLEAVVGDKKSVEAVTIKKLDVKQKIFASICGVGGLSGIITAIVMFFQ